LGSRRSDDFTPRATPQSRKSFAAERDRTAVTEGGKSTGEDH
jgi:hypothetical protein